MSALEKKFEEFCAIITLIIPALESLASTSLSNFWFWVSFSIIFAAVMYCVMVAFGRLVFKKYRLTLTQHVFWGFNSILSGCAILFWVVGQNLAPGLALLLVAWQGTINNDQFWADATNAACYQAVKNLGIEDFTNNPPPGLGVRASIPLNHPESQIVFTKVMMNRSAVHFSEMFPAIGRLLDVTDGLDTPSAEFTEMVKDYFDRAEPDHEGIKNLSHSESVGMCSSILRETFNSRVESLEILTIFVSIAVPTAAWLLLIVWVLCRSRRVMSNLIVTIQPN